MIDVQNLHLDDLTKGYHLAGMFDVLGPTHLRDVYEAFNTLFQLDESAVIGDGYHFPFDFIPFVVFLADVFPGMRLELF